MSEIAQLPSGWAVANINDTGRYINGFAFKPSHWGDIGRPIIRIQNLTDEDKTFNRTTLEVDDELVVHPGEIVVSWSATLDAFIWRRETAVLNQHIFRVVPERRLVHPGFLFYLLRSATWQMKETEHLHGSTMKHINRGPFLAHQIPLPPLSEQSRVVAEIEKQFTRLDAAMAALKRVQANLKRYRTSVLKAACEGRLVPTEAELARKEGGSYETGEQLLARILKERRAKWETDQLARMYASGKPPKNDGWKNKYKEPEPPDTSNLPSLPEGWEWAGLQQLTFIAGGITKGQKRDSNEELKAVPYLRVANVQRGYLDLHEIKTINATEEEMRDLQLRSGDVLFNEGGDRDKLGRGWIWEEQIPVCIHQNHVFRARIVPGAVLPKYVSHYANAHGQQYFVTEGKQTTNLASINLTKLSLFPVPLPPTAEQQRIVEELERQLSDITAADKTSADARSRADRLRQSILKRAFEGKLVPQDPNDEPASVLLERIRAERDAVSAQRGKHSHQRQKRALATAVK